MDEGFRELCPDIAKVIFPRYDLGFYPITSDMDERSGTFKNKEKIKSTWFTGR
jgi:hypothetical protein